MTYVLAIGDRSHSSWSLRGWLMFVRFGVPVTIRSAPMYTPAFTELLAGFGAARTVPALRIEEADGSVVLWDSLAIAETLAERHPDRGYWPAAPAARALARTLAAEMHSGFAALREICATNLRRAYVGFEPSAAVRDDLARIETLWATARAGHPGPWLFGDYSLADVFFAPVAARVATYDLPVSAEAAAYVAAHLADPAFLEWRAAGLAEPHAQPQYELDLPEHPWPGPAAA
jgi:glutathione S-transferase